MKISKRLLGTSAAVATAAGVGVLGTDVRSRWYRDLDKPAWQPPGAAFGPAWTTLYGLMAVASARTLDRLETPEERRTFATAFGANLALNAGWCWLFFTARRPRLALAEIALLEVSTLDLTRRAAKVDPPRRQDAHPVCRVGRLRHHPQRRHRPSQPGRSLMRLQRTVTVDKPLDKVFAYLSDFTTTTAWDPGTVRTVRTSGDGGFGTEYLNTSTFAGRETQLTYVVEDLVPNRHIALRGENRTVIAHDSMTFRSTGDDKAPTSTEVTYTADFTFKGIARLVAPFLKPAFKRLGDEAETGMATALAAL